MGVAAESDDQWWKILILVGKFGKMCHIQHTFSRLHTVTKFSFAELYILTISHSIPIFTRLFPSFFWFPLKRVSGALFPPRGHHQLGLRNASLGDVSRHAAPAAFWPRGGGGAASSAGCWRVVPLLDWIYWIYYWRDIFFWGCWICKWLILAWILKAWKISDITVGSICKSRY